MVNNHCKAASVPADPDELRLLNLQERLCKLQSELMPSEDPMAVPESPAPAPVDPDENLSKRSLNHPKNVTSRIARESNFSSTYNGFSLPVTPQVSLQPTGGFSWNHLIIGKLKPEQSQDQQLRGGFKYFLCSRNWENDAIWRSYFQMVWFNHQLDKKRS